MQPASRLELKEAQQTAGQAAENAVEDLLDGEEEAVDDLVEGNDELAQGEDQGRKVDQETS